MIVEHNEHLDLYSDSRTPAKPQAPHCNGAGHCTRSFNHILGSSVYRFTLRGSLRETGVEEGGSDQAEDAIKRRAHWSCKRTMGLPHLGASGGIEFDREVDREVHHSWPLGCKRIPRVEFKWPAQQEHYSNQPGSRSTFTPRDQCQLTELAPTLSHREAPSARLATNPRRESLEGTKIPLFGLDH